MEKRHRIMFDSSSNIILVSGSPEIQNWLDKTLFTSSVEACAPASDMVRGNALSLAATMKIFKSILDLRTHSVVFFHFKTSPQLLQLFRRMLQSCFATKLQKCSVDHVSLSNFSSAYRGDWISIIGLNSSFSWIYTKPWISLKTQLSFFILHHFFKMEEREMHFHLASLMCGRLTSAFTVLGPYLSVVTLPTDKTLSITLSTWGHLKHS